MVRFFLCERCLEIFLLLNLRREKIPVLRLEKKIASLINLPNPNCYTGHCWRGTAATLADKGLSVLQIKRKNVKLFLNLKHL